VHLLLIGYSERRRYFHETENVFEKTVAALGAGLTPVVCVGEVLEERLGGNTKEVLTRQFRGGRGELTADQFAGLAIA
jgi:triosephosphate isomerase